MVANILEKEYRSLIQSVKRTNDAPAIEADLALVACRVQDLLDLALAAHLLPEHRVPPRYTPIVLVSELGTTERATIIA